MAEPARVLLVHGPASHGWNAHEFPAGAQLLAECLNQAGLDIEATTSAGWPADESVVLNADAIVLYSDGIDAHVALGHSESLKAAYENGAGLAVLHFALEPPDADSALHSLLLDTIGGAFEVDWSVNPVWEMTDPILAEHPITRGVGEFSLQDEWYFHLRFDETHPGFTPLLQALPPTSTLGEDGPRSGNPAVRDAVARGEPQPLAWCNADDAGRRGFGFTGGHFHHNWANDDFRTLVLNGIVWTAGVEIPQDGISSSVAPIPHTRSLAEAIARKNLEDIRRHIALDPDAVNAPAHGDRTPLQLAAMRDNPAAAKLLLESGADPTVTTSSGETLLHLAVNRTSAPLASLLLDYPIDLSARDNTGWTVWHHAAAKNSVELINLFAERGHRPTQRSARGGTPLHEAAVRGSSDLIQRLLELGVDPTVVSEDGRTALDIAREYDNEAATNALAAATDSPLPQP